MTDADTLTTVVTTPNRPATGSPAAVRIAGWGVALPETRVPNAHFASTLDTTDDWIRSRTGIDERRVAVDGETTLPLAFAAARRALAHADVTASSVDLVVVATCTSEQPMPSTAASLAAALGCPGGAFDLDAACAGFVHALATVAAMLDRGLAHRALVIGADTMSRVVDPTDRSTAILFGDGAAALLLERPVASPRPSFGDDARNAGLLAFDSGTDPAGVDLLRIEVGGVGRPATADSLAQGGHYLRMDGPALFHRVLRVAAESAEHVLASSGCAAEEIRWFIPHQANRRITTALAARLGIPDARTASNIDRLGNTSAASIPLAIAELAAGDRLRDGDLLLVSGFGAGLSVATALWRWERA